MQRILRIVLTICGYIAVVMGAFFLILSLPHLEWLRICLLRHWDVSLCGLGATTIGVAGLWVRDARRRRGEQGE